MELIYSMRRKPLKCEPPHFESVTDPEVVRPICTISTCNIIAFTSPTELEDGEGDTWGGHVYVCDLDTPWNCHKVTSSAYPVSALEWDMEGKQLLVATTVGDITVFVQKDYLLNEWTCLYSASFPGEHIIRTSFFHSGRRFVVVDKKPDALITERIQMMRPTPTLKGFGGVPCEGACFITATGLIGLVTPPAEGTNALVATDTLRPTREYVTAATIALHNGNIVIAAVCKSGCGRSCVRCVVAGASAGPGGAGGPGGAAGAPRLELKPLHTIYLPPQDAAPVALCWCNREDTDALLIAGSTVTLWKCTERAHQVHKLLAKGPLQGSTTPGGSKPGGECFTTLVWQKAAAWGVEEGEHVGSACAAPPPAPPRAPAGPAPRAPAAPRAPLALLATSRALQLLARDAHHYVSSRTVVNTGGAAVEPSSTPPKKPKYGNNSSSARVSCAAVSVSCGVCVAVDTRAQLHVYKLPQPWADIPTPLAVQHATSLLEYCMVTGHDALDLLLTLKHNLVEAVYDRLTDSFNRQPASFQQYYYHSWLKLRIALCRLLPTLCAPLSWLSCLQALCGAWAGVALALRPDDKPDDKPLLALLDDTTEHDKTLLALESRSESITESQSLQPLRLQLQRGIDTALTALVALSHHHHHHQPTHGYVLWADPSAVWLLRKLCAVSRASQLAPEQLARVLARLAQHHKPDLIEESTTLTAQWSGARVWESLPRCSVAAPHCRQWPFYLDYGIEPESLRYNPEPPAYAQCETTPSVTVDAIRYMYLGGGWRPARVRECARCGARALPPAAAHRHPLQRAYEARFLPQCRCGGKWTLFSNI